MGPEKRRAAEGSPEEKQEGKPGMVFCKQVQGQVIGHETRRPR
jgi:hypothetical protein